METNSIKSQKMIVICIAIAGVCFVISEACFVVGLGNPLYTLFISLLVTGLPVVLFLGYIMSWRSLGMNPRIFIVILILHILQVIVFLIIAFVYGVGIFYRGVILPYSAACLTIALVLMCLNRKVKLFLIIGFAANILLAIWDGVSSMIYDYYWDYPSQQLIYRFCCVLSDVTAVSYSLAFLIYLFRNPLPQRKPIVRQEPTVSMDDITMELNRLNIELNQGLIDEAEYRRRRMELLSKV